MKEVGLWKVLLGIALVLLPGSLLILPLVVLFAGRRDLQKRGDASLHASTPVSGPTDLVPLTAGGDTPSVHIATV